MKKKLLSLIVLFLSILGCAQTFTVGNYTYKVTTSTTVEITAYNIAGGKDVVIPETASDNTTTYTVTRVANSVFEYIGIESLSMGSNLISIGENAFAGNSLTNLVLPSSMEFIGSSAFENSKIENLTLPNSLIFMGFGAFKLNLLTSLTIPGGITNIGSYAFQANELTSLTLSQGVKTIGTESFTENQLTSVFIPSSVLTIGKVAFGGTLTKVTCEGNTPPSINTGGSFDSFGSSIRGNIDLIIPAGTTGPYSTDAGAKWTGFNSVTEDPTLSIFSDFENEIYLYQTSNELNIVSPNTEKLNGYIIYNTVGTVVMQNGITENSINISSLASGYYILKLNYNKGTVTKRFLK